MVSKETTVYKSAISAAKRLKPVDNPRYYAVNIIIQFYGRTFSRMTEKSQDELIKDVIKHIKRTPKEVNPLNRDEAKNEVFKILKRKRISDFQINFMINRYFDLLYDGYKKGHLTVSQLAEKIYFA